MTFFRTLYNVSYCTLTPITMQFPGYKLKYQIGDVMVLMPGHVGHTMAAMSNASVTTTMAMILTNISMGPGMNNHNGSVHHPTHSMPNVTDHGHHGHHQAADNGSTMGHDHSNHMHHNESMNNGNHTGHPHGINGTHDDGTGGHSHHGNGTTGDGTTHDHGSSGNEGGHSGHATGHNMIFNFNMPILVLFAGWKVATNGQLAGACIAWFLLAVVHEALKNLRDSILTRSNNRKRNSKTKTDSNGSSDGDTNVRKREKPSVLKMFDGWHIFLSFLQIIQTTLGMFLMLVYMTFNVYLAISVSLGSGVGYWLFAWNRRPSNQFDDDHCV